MKGMMEKKQESTEKTSSGHGWNDLKNKITKVTLDYNPSIK